MEKNISGLFACAAVYLALLFAVAVNITWITSPDLGFHLRIGQYIWETRSIPRTELFSYTCAGHPMLLHGWLAETLFYLIWKLCGYNGLILLKTAVISSAYFLIHFLLAKKTTRIHETIAVTLAVLCSSWHFSERPAMFTLFFTALYVTLLTGLESGWKRTTVLPIIAVSQIFWSNLHGVFILGPVIVGLFAAGSALSTLARGEKVSVRESAVWILFVLALLVLSALLNPFGADLLLHPIRDISTPAIKQSVTEMMSPFSKSAFEQKYLLSFFVCFSLYMWVSLLANWRKVTAPQWLVAGAFFALSTTAIRMIPVFAFAALPLVIRNGDGLTEIMENLIAGKSGIFRQRARQIGNLLVLGILSGLIFCVYTNRYYIWQGYPERFGWGLSKVQLPVRAAEFLNNNPVSGSGFNLWAGGGYLMWSAPRHPVFIDGRLDVYGEDFMNYYLQAVSDPDHFANLLKKWQIEYIVLPAGVPLAARMVPRLHADPAWTLVFFDEGALVFVRKDGVNSALAQKRGINMDSAGRDGYEPVYSDSAGFPFQITDAPGIVRIAFTYEMFGNLDKAMNYYDMAMKSSAHLPADVYYNAGRIYLKRGDFMTAEHHFQQAVSVNSRFVMAYHAMALLRQRQGNMSAARALWGKALKIDPQFTPAQKALGADSPHVVK